MREVVEVSEVDGPVLTERLLYYLKTRNLEFDMLKPYFKYYPERIYKNMYEVGLLKGVTI